MNMRLGVPRLARGKLFVNQQCFASSLASVSTPPRIAFSFDIVCFSLLLEFQTSPNSPLVFFPLCCLAAKPMDLAIHSKLGRSIDTGLPYSATSKTNIASPRGQQCLGKVRPYPFSSYIQCFWASFQEVSLYPRSQLHSLILSSYLCVPKMTNGGGKPEAQRCQELSERLETNVCPSTAFNFFIVDLIWI